MSKIICIPILVFLAPLFGAQEDEKEILYQEGKKAFRGCAACHSVSEPSMKEDEDWLLLNKVTRCINAGENTERMRKALDVFFRSPKTRRPLLIDENYKPGEKQVCGKIKVPATSGSVFMKADRESIRKGAPSKVRLYWKKSEKGKELTLPVGNYRVITYRYYRTKKNKEKKDELWTLSVSDMNGCADLEITKEEATSFDLKPEVQRELYTELGDEGWTISCGVRNENDCVLTISVDGKMCLPKFVINDAKGKKLYEDTFVNT